MAIEIVSYPIKNGGSFHSFLYVYRYKATLMIVHGTVDHSGVYDELGTLWHKSMAQIVPIALRKAPQVALKKSCTTGKTGAHGYI
jgi:hypothetical protein